LPAPLLCERDAMKKSESRTDTAPHRLHATPTLALRYASKPPAEVIATSSAMLRLCCVIPVVASPGRPTHLLVRSPTPLDRFQPRRVLRQHFSRNRHGVPVPILPMSRELREELEPQEKASTRRLDTAVRAAQALRRAADIVVLTACPRCDTCVTVRRHAGGSNV